MPLVNWGLRVRLTAIAVFVLALLTQQSAAQRHEAPAAEQFIGTTPCDALPRRFLGIGTDSPCERISWQLALAKDPQTGQPDAFSLTAVHGMQMVNAPGFVDGGSTVRLTGRWSIAAGTRTNPKAIIYRLAAERQAYAEFARIGGNLLHLLSDDRSLSVGNAGWSYTLNRVGGTPDRALSTPVVSEQTVHKHAAGVFEGRTPCQDVARELKVSVGSDCTKMKWRLTLLENPATGTPTTYKLEGTIYRRAPRTGTWGIFRDPGTTAIVYRLDPDESGGSLSLLKADDNILFLITRAGDWFVGDGSFSYTLNRVAGS
jgi:hypothetical protein